jgi:hypothetical protein
MPHAADHVDPDDVEAGALSPDERRAFAALPREYVGSAALEERVVHALHDARLLGSSLAPSSGMRRLKFAASVLAASLVFFVGGIAVGRQSAHAEQIIVAPPVAVTRPAPQVTEDSMQLAKQVQRAGSEYVSLLERLPSHAPTDSPATRAELLGREAARSTLHAAARQLARVSPNDPVAMLLVEGLRPSPDARSGQVLWF